MRRNSIEFCKKGLTVVTEDADGRVYTIIATHISDILGDYHGKCDFVPGNDAPVHFAVYKGDILTLPEKCDFETLVSALEACLPSSTVKAG